MKVFLKRHFAVSRLWTDRSGATAIEYGLIASLIFLAIVASVGLFTDSLSNMFNTISNTLQGVF